jgi:hypothetical protein
LYRRKLNGFAKDGCPSPDKDNHMQQNKIGRLWGHDELELSAAKLTAKPASKTTS